MTPQVTALFFENERENELDELAYWTAMKDLYIARGLYRFAVIADQNIRLALVNLAEIASGLICALIDLGEIENVGVLWAAELGL